MLKRNKHFAVIVAVTLIGSLGYGIVIPVLFAYSSQYGLSPLALGILFSTFSIFEFVSTPFIGMLSDKYGRRPLLIASLIGTTGSFFLMAFAPSAAFLFLARALDGSTAGNLPVAQAIISDTTQEKERAKGFGIIGACYGIGIVAGPAIAALTAGVSIKLPFIIAGVLSALGLVTTIAWLKETNSHIGQVKKKTLFEWKKLGYAISERATGPTLFVSFLWSFAFGMFIYSYQSFSLKVLHFSPTQIALSFLLFGVSAVVTQLFIVAWVSKKFGNAKALTLALIGLAIAFTILIFNHGLSGVVIAIILLGMCGSALQTLVQTLLSRAASPERQGEILGFGASAISVGQIIGPITAGGIASGGGDYSFFISLLLVAGGLLTSGHIRSQSD